jgi:ATP-binding protein involved in chromosome partitioning
MPAPVALPGVSRIVAVGSGKGGVGKTTVAVNLAIALSKLGLKVGLIDADIYGPNIPTMMGTNQQPAMGADNMIQPIERHGLKTISIGYISPGDKPLVMRGPMLHQIIRQFLQQVSWGELDYLIVDLPPGTGDVVISLVQTVPLTGAVVVSTPSDVALEDARKALEMFGQVNVPILGIVENMSTHVCANCGHEEHIFGQGGGQKMAHDYGVTVLGSLPLDIRIREQADSGKPTVAADPESRAAQTYREIARRVAVKIAEKAQDFSAAFPKIVIKNT